ncbi:MAG TPA: phosphatidate cytidylyltransferase [Candidatus Binatia bacterium]|nr:phosphatidate cytidylyltransferase [Candidatus Binatia bacterium]
MSFGILDLDMAPSVGFALLGILALLVVASATSLILKARRPERDYTELRQRIRTWWIIVALFGVAIALKPIVAISLLGFVSFLAFKEYITLIPTRRADHRVLFWAYLAIPIQYYWAADAWYGMFIIFIPVYAFLLLPARMVLIGETEGFIRAAGTLHWGLMTTVFSLSHMAYLLVLPAAGNPAGGSDGLLVYLLLLTQLNDVAQYVWGKSLGRRKVVPKVSPKKTLEGLLGGIVTTVVVAVVAAPYLTPLNPVEALGAGLLIGAAGFLGDISVSAVKRDLGIKDSGNILPGHGGILDRVDSLTFTAPLFFHYVYYLHY